MKKDKSIYILTIYDCILRIEDYTDGYTLDMFLGDPKTQDAVIRNLEIIGQASKDFGIEVLTNLAPNTPWQQISGMRNIIAHEYLGLDMTIVWAVIEQRLQSLRSDITLVAKQLNVNLI